MIYFTLEQVTEREVGALGRLEKPRIELRDGSLPKVKEENGVYNAAGLAITDRIETVGEGIFAVRRRIENRNTAPVSFKDTVAVRDLFRAEKYLIPCVLYNGNEHGSSNTPKGLTLNGEPWVFSYDRTGIPSCTLTEDGTHGLALFASADSAASLVSCCSLIALPDGTHEHRVTRPVTEAPRTYSSKNIMTERYDTYHTLAPGATLETTTYIFVCRPRWENYAAANLIDACLGLLSPSLSPCLQPEKVFSLGISFANALLYDYKGQRLIITHFAQRLFRYQHMVKITPAEMAEMMKDPYYTELGRFDERFEIGWADQNLMNARMLAVDALRRGDQGQLKTAVGIFDAFCATQRPNGLCFTLYEQNYDPNAEKTATPDCCNLGWGASEAVRMFRLLQKNGIEKPEYLRFARGICDFFCTHYENEYGFGKSFYMDGTPAQKLGSIGGFLISALLDLYDTCGEKKYLDCARTAHDFYYRRDLDGFTCTAGALDCASIDKETAYPFVVSSLALYRITGEPLYLTRAQKAAYYFTSWMFFYDVLYPNGSEFTEYGYHTTGGTAISAEHHAIDSWGSVIVPELCELTRLTGDQKWEKIAKLMWANSIEGLTVSTEQLTHGVHRPLGAQNEGFFQARWTKYRPTCEDRGHFNDCLSAWTGAYRMFTVDRMETAGNLDLLR
ncbi:MAG: hypothetical protein ACI4WZ_02910 [Eubacteriales bacterium]